MTRFTAGRATGSGKAMTGQNEAPVALAELVRVFWRIGCLSFGGPAAQISLMHGELVNRRGWIREEEYLAALSFCMLLPGPEAMQLATWAGWRLRGTLGGLISGLLFVLPGAAVVLALSAAYVAFGAVPLVNAVFVGIQAAVVAIVIEALLRVSRRALVSPGAGWVSVLAFLALFLFNAPFPLIILLAGIWGAWTCRNLPQPPALPPPMRAQSGRTLAIWGVVWLLPLVLLWLHGGLVFEIGWFFSRLAVLTFGGAYAVLAWMTQEVVQLHGWLTTEQMMAGLGLAETTPGPLILVTEFVGFLAGYGAGGWPMALAGAGIALWMTFAPCFLWIFLGAPYLARLTAAPRLAGALAAILAAVVGVIAHLSLWFALHLFFARSEPLTLGPLHLLLPDLGSLRWLPALIALTSTALLLGLHRPLWQVLAVSVGMSLVGALMFGG